MRTKIGTLLAAAALAGSLAACGGESGGGDPTPGTPPPTSTSPTPRPTSPGPGPIPPTLPPAPEVTLTGRAVEGVEAGCTLLDTGAEQYLLTGEAAQVIEPGDTVTVRGRVRSDLLSTCQQGVPLEVIELLDRGDD